MMVGWLRASCPDNLKDQLVQIAKQNGVKSQEEWNKTISFTPTVQMHTLLDWIESVGWELVQMTTVARPESFHIRHTYVFRKI